MSATALIYTIIKLAEFLVLYHYGKRMANAISLIKFWQLAVVPIIFFALIEGLRWGHMIDYNVYAVRYGLVDNWFTDVEKSSPAFTVVVYALKCIGIPYSIFLVIQCGLLMFSGMFFLQNYKIYFKWILPCLLVAFSANENFIRFFFGLSFAFIGLYFFFKDKIVQSFSFFAIAIFIHFGLLPLIIFLLFSRIFNKKLFSPRISCILFIVATFTISISDLHFFISVADFVLKPFANSEYQLFTYARAMERVVSGEGGANMGVKMAQLSNQIKNLIIYVPIIVLAPKWVNKFEWGKYVYNMMIICIIISPIFGQVELLGRFSNALSIFCALCVAITFSFYVKKSVINEKRIYLLLFLSMFCYFYGYINAPFVRQEHEMYFIWDSDGSITNWAPYHRGKAW